MSGSSIEWILRTQTVATGNPPTTNVTEVVVRTLTQSSEISGTAGYTEESLAVPAGTTSAGFSVAEGVTVTLDASGIEWTNSVVFGGDGTINLTGGQFKSFESVVNELSVTGSLFENQVLMGGKILWVTDCLFNGADDTPIENNFYATEQLQMQGCEIVGSSGLGLAAGGSVSDNTFYGELYVEGPSEGTMTVIRNNTLLDYVGIPFTVPANVENNYYGAPASALFGEVLMRSWLNPYHLEPNLACANYGEIERCSRTEPRKLPPLRSVNVAVGQEMMSVDNIYSPDAYAGHLRAGQPLAMAFSLRSYVESLDGVSYELTYNGGTYSPRGSYTAKSGTEDISSGPRNARNTMNFIVPADAPGTNQWELWAEFGGCSANLVIPEPSRQCIASGAVVIQPAFARPLRIGVLELQLDDGYAIPRCDPTSRSKAIQQIRNDLIMKLPLIDAEVEVIDLGAYRFTGGLLSSWFSQTDLGRANQLTSELEWFTGDYNATVPEPLDFVVGVAPINALGGADGLSMALRRRAVLVDEFSPEAAFHEIGHGMELYIRSNEQYKYPYMYVSDGFFIPNRGLELAGMSAFNSSGKPSNVVPCGEIRHFPSCLNNGAYDVMGAINPQWISYGTHTDMTRWLINRLGIESASAQNSPLQIKEEPSHASKSETRTVHVAALISRTSQGDQMIAESIRAEEVSHPFTDSQSLYFLNFQFESYDDAGSRVTYEACKTPIADVVTNAFWQQTFTVPTDTVRYRIVQTPSAQQSGYSEIWTYQSPAAISNDLQLEYASEKDEYVLTFNNSGTRRSVENRLLTSRDAGATWMPLPLPAYTNQMSIPRTAIVSDNALFRLSSSDGIQTTISSEVAVGLTTNLSPVVRILNPQDGLQGLTGTVWSIEADIYDPNDNLDMVQWRSNLDGVLGYGTVLSDVLLSEGSHQLDVIATDSGGLSTTDSVSVIVGDLATVDLMMIEKNLVLSPSESGYEINVIGYGMTNRLDVTFQNQGISNTVQIQVYLTRPGEAEGILHDESLQMNPFDLRSISLNIDAPFRGSYQVRALCTSLDIPDSNTNNNQVVVSYTNQPPRIYANRLSVLADDLPLQVQLAARDPNGDAVTFALIPSDGASLSGGDTLVFDNGGSVGSHAVQITASDEDLTSAPATVMIDVYQDQPVAFPPVITSSSSFSVPYGVPMSIWITAHNGPCIFSAVGMPFELSLNENSGEITGQLDGAGTYLFSVIAQNGAGSNSMQISLIVEEPVAPANDNFADAELLSGVPLTINGSTAGATRETDEPNHAGYPVSNTIWWRWTAPSNGVAGIQWSGMNAAIAIYTGSTLGTLVEQSAVYGTNTLSCFNAVSGQDYFIALGTFEHSAATLMLAFHSEPILRAPLSITAVEGQSVDVTFVTWNTATNFSASGLPDGLMLNAENGHLTGMPTGYGNSSAIITVANAAGSTSASVEFRVQSLNAPRITSPLYATATIGEEFSYTVQVENGSQCSIDVTSSLQDLSFNGTTWILSGVPSETGLFSIYISAWNTNTYEMAFEEVTLFVHTPYPNGGGPSWWYTYGVLSTNALTVTNDYAAANQGQVKWIVTGAYNALIDVYGSVSPALSNLVNNLENQDNYTSVNVGQVKACAEPFYQFLSNSVPWTASTADDKDFSAANIGQVKNAFNFTIP